MDELLYRAKIRTKKEREAKVIERLILYVVCAIIAVFIKRLLHKGDDR